MSTNKPSKVLVMMIRLFGVSFYTILKVHLIYETFPSNHFELLQFMQLRNKNKTLPNY